MFGKDRYAETGVERGENAGSTRALQHDRPRPPGPIELLQGKSPPSAVRRIERERRRLFRVEPHRAPGRPHARLAAERNAVAFSDLTADDRDVELTLIHECRDVGTDAELDLLAHCGITGCELSEQRR